MVSAIIPWPIMQWDNPQSWILTLLWQFYLMCFPTYVIWEGYSVDGYEAYDDEPDIQEAVRRWDQVRTSVGRINPILQFKDT